LRLQVRGESMLPTLWPGDIAEIAFCSLRDVRRGEIVLGFREGRFFLHRLLSPDRESFVTLGDSMPSPDPVFPANALLGKLMTVNRAGKLVSGRLRPWSRAVGMVVCYCSFARHFALRLHSSRHQARPLLNPEIA
jgi:hypothetical protein